MLIECQMLKCSDVPMIRCSNVPMFQCSNVPMFQCSNFQMFKYQMSNVNKVNLLSQRTSGVPPVIFYRRKLWIDMYGCPQEEDTWRNKYLFIQLGFGWISMVAQMKEIHMKEQIFGYPSRLWMNMYGCQIPILLASNIHFKLLRFNFWHLRIIQ